MSTSKNHHAFPWGIYIGDLMDNGDRLPLYLPSHIGGFTLLYDDHSENCANSFIESVSLKLFEVLPIYDIKVDVFDFGYKKRFRELSMLKNVDLYEISLTVDDANIKFKELERVSLYRHHELLSPTISNISQYNQTSSKKEIYHLLLINLEHYPNSLLKSQEISEFLDSSFEVGFYTIAFGNKSQLDSKKELLKNITDRFPLMEFRNKKFQFTKKLFEFYDLTQQYNFKYIDYDRVKIVEKLYKSIENKNSNNNQNIQISEGNIQ